MKFSTSTTLLMFAMLLYSCGKHLIGAGFMKTRNSFDKIEAGMKPGEAYSWPNNDWISFNRDEDTSGIVGVPTRNDRQVKQNEKDVNAKSDDEDNSVQLDPEIIKQAEWIPRECLLFPCTMSGRYRMCRKGSLLGHNAQFTYIPYNDITQRVTVHGVEFRWPDLKQKLSPDSGEIFPMKRQTSKDTNHYYLNVRRCAYGRRYLGSGPVIFAVNQNCTKVFYYQSAPFGGWRPYRSVEMYFKNQLKCSFFNSNEE